MKKTSSSIEKKKDITIKLNDWKVRGAKKWGDKCEVCGATEYVQGHHAFPFKGFSILRYDVDNYVPLCRGCHSKLERFKGFDVIFKVISNRGIGWLNKLLKKI